MVKQRTFVFNGDELTRGQHGVRIDGGHNTDEAPDHISVFDPDFGDTVYASIERCLADGDWEEITTDNV